MSYPSNFNDNITFWYSPAQRRVLKYIFKLGENVSFNKDGSIDGTFSDGSTEYIVFNKDGTITQQYTGATNAKITTYFLPDGSIKQVVQ